MRAIGRPTTAAGVASLYAGLIGAMVVDSDDPDDPPGDVEVLSAPTMMSDRASRAAVARAVLEFAGELTSR
jgi:hypothetical protein